MGTDVLASIARDLVRTLRCDVTTDWVSRDDVRAKIRSTIKRLLAKYGYPPDGRDDATNLVLRQMETFADEWSPDAAVRNEARGAGRCALVHGVGVATVIGRKRDASGHDDKAASGGHQGGLTSGSVPEP